MFLRAEIAIVGHAGRADRFDNHHVHVVGGRRPRVDRIPRQARIQPVVAGDLIHQSVKPVARGSLKVRFDAVVRQASG